MNEKNDAVENLNEKKTKDPVEAASNKLTETENKRIDAEIAKAVEEVAKAKKVLVNAIQKVRDLREEKENVDKLNVNELAKALGI